MLKAILVLLIIEIILHLAEIGIDMHQAGWL